MPNKIEISLKGIVAQVGKAESELSAAKGKAKNTLAKKRVAAKIKRLKKVKMKVQQICKGIHSYTITVPT